MVSSCITTLLCQVHLHEYVLHQPLINVVLVQLGADYFFNSSQVLEIT